MNFGVGDGNYWDTLVHLRTFERISDMYYEDIRRSYVGWRKLRGYEEIWFMQPTPSFGIKVLALLFASCCDIFF